MDSASAVDALYSALLEELNVKFDKQFEALAIELAQVSAELRKKGVRP